MTFHHRIVRLCIVLLPEKKMCSFWRMEESMYNVPTQGNSISFYHLLPLWT